MFCTRQIKKSVMLSFILNYHYKETLYCQYFEANNSWQREEMKVNVMKITKAAIFFMFEGCFSYFFVESRWKESRKKIKGWSTIAFQPSIFHYFSQLFGTVVIEIRLFRDKVSETVINKEICKFWKWRLQRISYFFQDKFRNLNCKKISRKTLAVSIFFVGVQLLHSAICLSMCDLLVDIRD